MYKYLLVFTVTLLMSLEAKATWVVVDPTNLIQNTITSVKAVEEVVALYKQIDNQIRQIQNQIEAFENMNGDYFKRALLNGTLHKKLRRWIPRDYAEIERLFQSQTQGIQYRLATIAGWRDRDSLKIISASEVADNLVGRDSERWEQREIDLLSGAAVSDGAFRRSSELIDDAEGLIRDIGSDMDAKAAMDLQNRMQGQSQLAIAELLRLNAANAKADAKQRLYEHALRAEDVDTATVEEIPSIIR